MPQLTQKQAVRIIKKSIQIQTLAAQMLMIISDDPMFGDLWSSLNRISGGAQDTLDIAHRSMIDGGR